MNYVVRAVDVGYGNTKFVTGITGDEIRCASFPSFARATVRDPATQDGLERRRVIGIPIRELFYEVGPDVDLGPDSIRTHLHDGYTATDEYLALLRGSLAMMKVPEIDLLIVGLPVSALRIKKSALEKLAVGVHNVGGGKQVLVRKALAISQPHGALVDFTHQYRKADSIADEKSLIVDPGYRTFDWLVVHGQKIVQDKCRSENRGVYDILNAVADEVGLDLRIQFRNVDAIDLALRSKKRLRIRHDHYDLVKAAPIAFKLAQEVVGRMRGCVGEGLDYQNLVLVGGGAHLFKKALKDVFPENRIYEVKDPMYSNVRGFQIVGMNQVSKLLSSSGSPQNGGSA